MNYLQNLCFTFLGRDIPVYGFLIMIGGVLSVSVALILLKKVNLEFFDFMCCVAFIIIGAFVGAKLLSIITAFKDIIEFIKLKPPFFEGFMIIMQGGFVFYGGLIGGLIALILYCKVCKVSLRPYISVAAAALPLGHAFGRVGCFFAGCCYGMPYDGWLSHTYTHADNPTEGLLGVPRFPVQLLEACCLLILFAILLYVFIKKPNSYATTIGYIIGYGILRFCLEFLRGDKERGGFLGVSTSQWISILLVTILITIIIIYNHQKKKKAVESSQSIEDNKGETTSE
jgi:phosphatidylglycerol:prolipoprotein diacylglycerol transferase